MIHPTALIDKSAQLAEDVSVGPYAIIGAGVEINSGTTVGPHTVINGPTSIGKNNKIFQFASIGEEPQDKKYNGEPTRLEIGNNNVIREYCTISRGTVQDEGVTRVANDNWIMAYVHIAHDCKIGSHTIFANSASLAGHVEVEDYAILGGFTLAHQFCKIGAHCFTALGTVIKKDIPPYLMIAGNPAKPFGLNQEGLKRRGMDGELLAALKTTYKLTYRAGNSIEQAITELSDLAEKFPEVKHFVNFLSTATRGIVR